MQTWSIVLMGAVLCLGLGSLMLFLVKRGKDSYKVCPKHLPYPTNSGSPSPSGGGSCTARDQQNWTGGTNGQDFANFLSTQGRKCWGSGTCIKKALTRGYPDLSSGCADCFVKAADCSKSNCIGPCLTSASSKGCIDCVAKNCNSGLAACAGVSPLPPNPS